jgi:branched-subunit amino acid transport protein AzlD
VHNYQPVDFWTDEFYYPCHDYDGATFDDRKEEIMFLTPLQTCIMIFAVALGAELARFLPFILFPENKELPKSITYLGKVLPPAILALLVVLCFKDTSIVTFPFGIPEIIASIVVICLHFWKKNALLSIAIGTIVYMICVQVLF